MGQDYIPSLDQNKEKRYQYVLKAWQNLLDKQAHPLSNLSNFLAILKQEFGWLWIGYYFISKQNSQIFLQLGPFQGPLACTKIKKGKGVCGSSWQQQKTIVVPDVQKFPGHIACSSISKSQIVIPLFHQKSVIGVLDIDSKDLNTFDQIDQIYLKKMVVMMEQTNLFKWISQKF